LKGSSGEFFTGVPSFLTGFSMSFIKTLVEAFCEDTNVVLKCLQKNSGVSV